jgi:UPF0176 protein
MSSTIFVLLYYKFVNVPNAEFEIMQHKLVCAGIGLKGRILIASEGINGTVAGTRAQLKQYTDYMEAHPQFGSIVFKRTPAGKMPFGKLIVKYRPEIVTLGKSVDMSKTGKYLTPEEFHNILENEKDIAVVDMRNNYEYEVGRFDGAIQPDTTKFYELPKKIKNLKLNPNQKVLTYCTGGIRCEKATALLAEEGFEDVYQLEGGIAKYLEKYPDGHFKGKNFVFDERMVTNTDTQSGAAVLGKCAHCKKASDRYIDCTKPDCHQLFICCKDCQKQHSGLCPVAVKELSKK